MTVLVLKQTSRIGSEAQIRINRIISSVLPTITSSPKVSSYSHLEYFHSSTTFLLSLHKIPTSDMKIFIFIATLAITALALPPKLDPNISKTLERTGIANIIISFKNSNVSQLRRAVTREGHLERSVLAWRLYETLQDHADQTQAEALAALSTLKARNPLQIRQLWITNQLIVRNISRDVFENLVRLQNVSAVQEEKYFPLDRPKAPSPTQRVSPMTIPQWNVEKVGAPAMWKTGTMGQGTVVASIDTGVHYMHEALRDNYRATFGWYDPWFHTQNPFDNHGSGTHNMGIMVGRGGIGVAPAAKWITCKGMNGRIMSDATMLECGQWISCPTDPSGERKNCSLAPHVVSNGWEWFAGTAERAFIKVLEYWRALNIVPVFAIGDKGPYCYSTVFPGNSPLVIGVGVLDWNNAVVARSSRGPTPEGKVKPDIAAPGLTIYSAHHTSNTAYKYGSGSDVASSHVAGVAALLHSAVPGVTVDQVHKALIAGAQRTSPQGIHCGGAGTYPNNDVGYGMVNANASLNALKKLVSQV